MTAAAGETSAVRFGFVIDNRRCIGCHACTVACKSEHDVPLGVNRTWVKQVETGSFPDVHRSFHVLRCNHCADAPCVEICPVSALYVRPNGIVDFDNGRCIGCKGCLQACPYDALYIDPRNDTAAKCNFCSHRVERGLQPACVVACPEQAIVAGDLQDPGSFIAQLVATQPVQVRKPEKGTRPSLYYIDGEREALDPMAADNRRCTTTDRPSDRRPLEALGVIAETQSRVSYDAPKNAPPWGWHVSAYLLTKALAAGLLMLPLAAQLLPGPGVQREMLLACGVASLVFQAATAALLVADLQRPDRFLNVLLRGNPTSWLVRGAWILTALGGASTLWLVSTWLGWGAASPAGWITLLLSPAAAIYTAFLFAQARGRDLWQSRLQPLHMGLHGLVAGAAGVLLLAEVFGGGGADIARWVLLVGLPLDALLALSEIVLPHATPAAAAAARHLHTGEAALRFWGVIVAGSVLGAALATIREAAPAAALIALLVIYVRNDLWVRAGQKVPLS